MNSGRSKLPLPGKQEESTFASTSAVTSPAHASVVVKLERSFAARALVARGSDSLCSRAAVPMRASDYVLHGRIEQGATAMAPPPPAAFATPTRPPNYSSCLFPLLAGARALQTPEDVRRSGLEFATPESSGSGTPGQSPICGLAELARAAQMMATPKVA